MQKWFFKLANTLHIFLFKLSSGVLGSKIAGMPILLLTTTGRKTGKERTTPLGYLTDKTNYVVIASNAGLEKNPGWFFNLRASPKTTIQLRGKTKTVTASEANEKDRQRLWKKVIEIAPGYESYQKRTKRKIPLVILHPTM